MSVQPDEVWQRLAPADQAEVVTAINHILMEVLDEHFRISAAQSPDTTGSHLYPTVDNAAGHPQPRELKDSVRSDSESYRSRVA